MINYICLFLLWNPSHILIPVFAKNVKMSNDMLLLILQCFPEKNNYCTLITKLFNVISKQIRKYMHSNNSGAASIYEFILQTV
jgi:hypothetical protein